MQKENFITSEKLAQLVEQSESSVIKLCEDGLINANYENNQWLISENVELPCIKYLNEFDKMNPDNVNILNRLYEVVHSEELACWFYGIYHDDKCFC